MAAGRWEHGRKHEPTPAKTESTLPETPIYGRRDMGVTWLGNKEGEAKGEVCARTDKEVLTEGL